MCKKVKKIAAAVNLKNNAGKTTFCLNMAAMASREKGKKTLYIDLSEDVFESARLLKKQAGLIYDAKKPAGEYLLKKEGFYAACCRYRDIKNIITKFYEDMDIILIDANYFPGAVVFEASDAVFILSPVSPIDVEYANLTLEKIKSNNYPLATAGIVVNKCGDSIVSAADFSEVFGGAEIKGALPYEAETGKLAEKGEILYFKNKKCAYIKAVAGILNGFMDKKESRKHLEAIEKAVESGAVYTVPGEEEGGKEGSGRPGKEDGKINALKKDVHEKLFEKMDIAAMEKDALSSPEKRKKIFAEVKGKIREIADRLAGALMDREEREGLIKEVFDEVAGLGAIEGLLKDRDISEVMVNSHREIYIEKSGKLIKSSKKFTDDSMVMRAIERIVMPLGRRIDESVPYVDARLADGSRVNAIIPPLAIDGPALTIRKFSDKKLTINNLVSFGSVTKQAADYLQNAVESRRNIIVSGGTGSGKTTLLNVLSSFIPRGERIITVEDSAELRLSQEHVIRLEARPPNIEGKGAVTIRDLVKNCLRMRPDRIVVGECRGAEALDMLQAMNTGHEGSMTTVHANTPRDALSRLEVMVLMAGMDLPLKAVREQVKSAVDIIVQQARMKGGSRKITAIAELTGMEGDTMLMHNVFEHTGDKGLVKIM